MVYLATNIESMLWHTLFLLFLILFNRYIINGYLRVALKRGKIINYGITEDENWDVYFTPQWMRVIGYHHLFRANKAGDSYVIRKVQLGEVLPAVPLGDYATEWYKNNFGVPYQYTKSFQENINIAISNMKW